MYEHKEGTVKCYTTGRRPVELVYKSDFSTREEALEQELRIEGWSREKKEALIKGDWDEVVRLSNSNRSNPSTGSG